MEAARAWDVAGDVSVATASARAATTSVATAARAPRRIGLRNTDSMRMRFLEDGNALRGERDALEGSVARQYVLHRGGQIDRACLLTMVDENEDFMIVGAPSCHLNIRRERAEQ